MPATAKPTSDREPHDVGDRQRDHGLVAVQAGRPQRAGGHWPTSARWVSAAPFGLPVVPDV